jgi:hypothetical protein
MTRRRTRTRRRNCPTEPVSRLLRTREPVTDPSGEPRAGSPKRTEQGAKARDRRREARAAAGSSGSPRPPARASSCRRGHPRRRGARGALADVDAAARHQHRELTVDVETPATRSATSDYALRTVQLGNEHFAVVLDPPTPTRPTSAAGTCRAAPVLHAHSATADLVPLADAGLVDLEDGWARMHDTVIPAKLADPASDRLRPGLKKLAATCSATQRALARSPTRPAPRCSRPASG